MTRTNIIHCILILLLQLYIISVTKAIDEVVNVKIKNGDKIIELKWKRTSQHLANNNLPVWYAEKQKAPRLELNVLQRLSEFITYHDVEKSSAVVYFKKFNTFYGVIDTRYYITRLPLNVINDNEYVDIDSDYIYARPIDDKDTKYFHHSSNIDINDLFNDDQMNYILSVINSFEMELSSSILPPSSQQIPMNNNIPQIPSTSKQNEFPQFQFDNHNLIAEQQNKQQIATVRAIYPEILVFITNDVVTAFRNIHEGKAILLLELYYIIYFNAIDMLFAKLATDDTAIHINIAGFVIESQYGVFPLSISTNTGNIYHHSTLCNIPEYIHNYRSIFPEDSFDFFFVSTRYRMEMFKQDLYGVSRAPFDIYVQRISNKPHQYLLGSIVTQRMGLSDYIVATREIAKLMGIRSDLSRDELSNDIKCHSIAENGKTYCENCLNWSDKSREEFSKYIRSNRNHCYLLNYPRSLYPYGYPIKSLDPEVQCICYGFSPDNLDPRKTSMIPRYGCNRMITCTYGRKPKPITPFPLDGTPCGINKKVCWNKKCVVEGESVFKIVKSDSSYGPKSKRLRTNDNNEREKLS